MSRTLNKVMLIGNVGRDPDLKHTPSGIPVITFRIATTETWKNREGKMHEHTDWHTVVAWRGLAEIINKLVRKGSRIYIEGRLQTRQFDDKEGNRRYVVEVLADNMLLLDSKKERYGSGNHNHNDSPQDDYDYNNTGERSDDNISFLS